MPKAKLMLFTRSMPKARLTFCYALKYQGTHRDIGPIPAEALSKAALNNGHASAVLSASQTKLHATTLRETAKPHTE